MSYPHKGDPTKIRLLTRAMMLVRAGRTFTAVQPTRFRRISITVRKVSHLLYEFIFLETLVCGHCFVCLALLLNNLLKFFLICVRLVCLLLLLSFRRFTRSVTRLSLGLLLCGLLVLLVVVLASSLCMVLAMTNEVCQRSVSGYTMTRQALTMSSLLKASTTPVPDGMGGSGCGQRQRGAKMEVSNEAAPCFAVFSRLELLIHP